MSHYVIDWTTSWRRTRNCNIIHNLCKSFVIWFHPAKITARCHGILVIMNIFTDVDLNVTAALQ